jgi:hypothetical protein
VRHVVQGLEDRHEVVQAGQTRVCSVAAVELDPVLETAVGQVLPRELDRELVEVDPVTRA